ncbi:MAG: glycosyl transferase [Betaproteobacteria bacterium]|nr:glycosyl transferase [Betaproteobacteria bacterium]
MNTLGLDAIFVINVRSFTERRRHVESELGRFGLTAEFVHEYDADDLTPGLEERWFVPGADLRPNQKSCALKHVAALERVRERACRAALVLEDDVVLDPAFPEGIRAALDEGARWPEPRVTFVGSGGNFFTPRSERRPGQRLYPARRGRFGDSYILGAETAGRRLDWIAAHRIARPIDNQFEAIDLELGITMLWLEDPVVEQGSKNGRFQSMVEPAPPPPIQRLKFGWEKFRRKYLYQLWR